MRSDGIQNDGASAALVGIVVTLRDAAGTLINTTTTSASGLYSFSSLDVAALRPSTAYRITIQLDSQSALATTVGGRPTFLVPTITGSARRRTLDF